MKLNDHEWCKLNGVLAGYKVALENSKQNIPITMANAEAWLKELNVVRNMFRDAEIVAEPIDKE